MTWLLVVPAILILGAVVLTGYLQWIVKQPKTPLDERLGRVDQELFSERERLEREHAYRRGPRGWMY